MPCYMAREAPELRRVLRGACNLELDLWLLTHRDLRRTARIGAVLGFLCEEIRRDRGLLIGAESEITADAGMTNAGVSPGLRPSPDHRIVTSSSALVG